MAVGRPSGGAFMSTLPSAVRGTFFHGHGAHWRFDRGSTREHEHHARQQHTRDRRNCIDH